MTKRIRIAVGSVAAAVLAIGVGLAIGLPAQAGVVTPATSVVTDTGSDGETADDTTAVEDGTNDGETADDTSTDPTDGQTADGETAD
ncbi:hypothetical protein BH11ACT4_BH11ACT4_15860 [soil metagenome]